MHVVYFLAVNIYYWLWYIHYHIFTGITCYLNYFNGLRIGDSIDHSNLNFIHPYRALQELRITIPTTIGTFDPHICPVHPFH